MVLLLQGGTEILLFPLIISGTFVYHCTETILNLYYLSLPRLNRKDIL